jgi:hypothetical protein
MMAKGSENSKVSGTQKRAGYSPRKRSELAWLLIDHYISDNYCGEISYSILLSFFKFS